MPTVTKAANAHTVVATGWTTPTNAYATTGDNVYATTASTSKNVTLSGDFGFPNFTSGDIPDGATITAVRAVGEWGFTSAITGATLGCQPRVGGANSGSEVTKTTTTEAAFTATFGTVTLADLRAASTDIKARVRSSRGNTTTASTFRLDFIALEVDYSINADGLFTATGGGTTPSVSQKGGQLALGLTGGGVTAITGEAAEPDVETHSGDFDLTGGGAVATADSTARNLGLAATGGGAVAHGASTARDGAVALTGAGAAAAGASTARDGGFGLTGAGAVSASVEAARLGAALMSGGGVLAVGASTERSSGVAVTGGGAVAVTGTASSVEEHQGSVVLAGGGATTVAAQGDRQAGVLMSGGGVVAIPAVSDRVTSFGITGGGTTTLATATPADLPDISLTTHPVGISVTTSHVDIEVEI